MNRIYKLSIVALSAWVLSACGGGGDEWGIDQSNIPMCSGDVNDSSAAISVPAGTVIKSIVPDTTVRVWHYSNSEKLVCLLTGKAVISGGN